MMIHAAATDKKGSRMPSSSLWRLVVLVLLLPPFCRATFLSEPSLRWSVLLERSTGQTGSRGLRRGNAVVEHPDGSKLIVTADDGSLHILETATNGTTLAVFEPEPQEGLFTECRSGATIVQPDENGDELIVYAIIDTPSTSDEQVNEGGETVPSDSNRDDSVISRVVAVGMDGTFQWGVVVPGRIVGNPVLGETKPILYVSHNVNGVGAISVIQMNSTRGSATIVATFSSPVTEQASGNGPFGPPVVQPGGSTTVLGGDIVLVAESWGGGFTEDQGGLYMLSPTAEFEATGGLSTESYQLQRISSWPSSAIAAPLIEGDSVFLSAAGGTVVGWTGNERNDLSGVSSGRNDIDPSWVFEAEPNELDASQPLLSTPVLDSFGSVLIVAGVNNDLYAVDTTRGRGFWSISGGSQIVARPQLWETDELSVVYVIESLDGTIGQYELYSGQRLWGFGCDDISGSSSGANELCPDAVEAEFAIAPSGNAIYYGDIFGRITSLEIASFATESPTSSPTASASSSPTEQPQATSLPTAFPSDVPSINPSTPGLGKPVAPIASPSPDDSAEEEAPTTVAPEADSLNSEQQGAQSDGSVSVAVYIGAGVAALCVLIIPIVIFSMMRRHKHNPKKRDEMGVEIIEECEAEDPESFRLDEATLASGSDGGGIEVEFVGSKSVPRTPPGLSNQTKKKKKKRKQSPQTPATAQTLESIEELPDESPSSGSPKKKPTSTYQFMEEDDDDCINAINLSDKFAMVAESRISEQKSHIESDSSYIEESGRVTPVARGGVGRPRGSDHLELSVGNNDLTPLTSLAVVRLDEMRNTSMRGGTSEDGGISVRSASAEHGEGDYSDDEEAPPPPPQGQAPTGQWSFYSLLQMSSSQPSKKKDPNPPAPVRNHSKSVKTVDSASPRPPLPKKDFNDEEGADSPIKHTKAATGPSNSMNSNDSNQKVFKDLQTEKNANSNVIESEDSIDLPQRNYPQVLHSSAVVLDPAPVSSIKDAVVASPTLASIEQRIAEKDDGADPTIPKKPRSSTSPDNNVSEDSTSFSSSVFSGEFSEPHALQETDPSDHRLLSSEEHIEEEKKENEVGDESTPQSPGSLRSSPISPSLVSRDRGFSPTSPSSSTGPLDLVRATSPSTQSVHSAESSRISALSPSNASTDDDSMYTSATGKTGQQQIDTSNLSPLSACIFDKDIERDAISMALAQPELRKAPMGRSEFGSNDVHYDEDDDAPDDELVVAPGSQYMFRDRGVGHERKYGRSVRSKREASTFQQIARNDSNNSFGSYDSDRESPLAAIYNQLAAMGQQKAEEKRHSYKRRSKKEEKHEPPLQQHESDTWGNFLNELAEAEKQFFASNSAQQPSMLQFGNSHDSEDSEVARINTLSQDQT